MNIVVGNTVYIHKKKVVVTDVKLTYAGKSGYAKICVRGKDTNGNNVETMWSMEHLKRSCGHDGKYEIDGFSKCKACHEQRWVPEPES